MAPVSDDVGEALSFAIVDCGCHISINEEGDGPTEVAVSENNYEGSSSVQHDFDDDGNYIMTERSSDYDPYDSLRARSICLAILNMYRPSEEELRAAGWFED